MNRARMGAYKAKQEPPLSTALGQAQQRRGTALKQFLMTAAQGDNKMRSRPPFERGIFALSVRVRPEPIAHQVS